MAENEETTDDIITPDENNDEVDVVETSDEEEATAEEAEEKKTEAPDAKLARLERQAKQLRKKLGKEEKPKVEKPKAEQVSSELSDAEYALLAAKDIEDDEDVAFVEKYKSKWDMSLREVLKDEDVKAKLQKMKQAREVKAATPGSTKRGGGQSDGFDIAVAKFEKTGELPKDFEMRQKVVDSKIDKESSNKPSWR